MAGRCLGAARCPRGVDLDKRVSTALTAVRDTLVAMLVSLPLAVPLLVVIWLRTPEPAPDIGRARQVIDAAGLFLPLALMTASLGFLMAGWWFRRTRPVEGWERRGPPKLAWLQAIPLGIVVGFCAQLLAAIVTAITLRLAGLEIPEDELMTALASASRVSLAAVVVLVTAIAPVGEEVFFRGHLFRWSASRCGRTYAYVLTTTLFALGHGNLYAIPFYVITGLILAWSYQRWRTLVVPIAAHATINALAILALLARVARA